MRGLHFKFFSFPGFFYTRSFWTFESRHGTPLSSALGRVGRSHRATALHYHLCITLLCALSHPYFSLSVSAVRSLGSSFSFFSLFLTLFHIYTVCIFQWYIPQALCEKDSSPRFGRFTPPESHMILTYSASPVHCSLHHLPFLSLSASAIHSCRVGFYLSYLGEFRPLQAA